uniref:Cytochrome c oxidase subunit 2 n=1 Tax=Atergatis integerrimus TaxID=903645 RepID=A0A343UMC4_ATEIN|nr:cytochrome c oxidase subunit II [Atergatis integerrimus]AVA09733.1 cytochrome c oxidase subunit 2 [Atergatis integerrimus]AVE15424.1 cytochrome c oxidase subunit II [Atergatis integerrimus]
MATWTNLGFQDGASPLMEQLIFFHDHIMLILILIITFVGYILSTVLSNSLINRYMLEHQTIEMIWTSVPAIILIFIALPSLRLLYLLDEVNTPAMTLKTIGHQWYWSYEYSDFLHLEFDSYMIPSNDLESSGIRLLDVDNRTVLPMNAQIRILISAADVIHSWTIPALGIKADAIPGRLNQASFLINRPGLFFGQCSEICGANHSFMPIVIESVSTNAFLDWISSASD